MLFKIYFEPRFKYLAISKYSQISLSRSRWDCLNTFTLTYPLFSKYQCSRYLSSTVFYDPGTVIFLIEIYCFILLIRMKPFILFVKTIFHCNNTCTSFWFLHCISGFYSSGRHWHLYSNFRVKWLEFNGMQQFFKNVL